MTLGRVEISRGFLFLAAWLFYRDRSGLVWMAFLACVLHELGHLAALHLLGIHVCRVRVTVFGARMELCGGASYPRELAAAAAGPLVNLVLAYACCRCAPLRLFAGANLALAAFNLLPVGELDGGRILDCLLHLLCPDRTAARMRAAVGVLCGAVFLSCALTAALTGGNATLCLVCLWLFTRQGEEKRFQFLKKERNRSCHGIGKRLE